MLDAVAPNTVTSILLMAAGLVLILNVHAGLYVLIAPVLAALAGGVINGLPVERVPAAKQNK